MPIAGSPYRLYRYFQILSGAVTSASFPGWIPALRPAAPDARRIPLCEEYRKEPDHPAGDVVAPVPLHSERRAAAPRESPAPH